MAFQQITTSFNFLFEFFQAAEEQMTDVATGHTKKSSMHLTLVGLIQQ